MAYYPISTFAEIFTPEDFAFNISNISLPLPSYIGLDNSEIVAAKDVKLEAVNCAFDTKMVYFDTSYQVKHDYGLGQVFAFNFNGSNVLVEIITPQQYMDEQLEASAVFCNSLRDHFSRYDITIANHIFSNGLLKKLFAIEKPVDTSEIKKIYDRIAAYENSCKMGSGGKWFWTYERVVGKLLKSTKFEVTLRRDNVDFRQRYVPGHGNVFFWRNAKAILKEVKN